VAAILPGEFAQEGWPPQRGEAVTVVGGRQAAELGVDEHHPSARLDGHVVDVEVARRVADAGDVQAVVAVVGGPGSQDVFEAPELVERGHPQSLAVAPQPHTSLERLLEHGEPAVGGDADQDELAALVRGDGQTDTLLGEPGRELT